MSFVKLAARSMTRSSPWELAKTNGYTILTGQIIFTAISIMVT